MNKFFKGLYTAIITPFSNDKIDFEAFKKLLKNQIDAKVDGIVVAGSTGEVASLSIDEYEDLVKFARNNIPSSVKLVASISANIPSNALKYVKIAESSGVDGLMCITPYYNKAPQRGLYEYFKIIHENSNLPIMLYTVPSRTGVDFKDETLIELSKLERIVSIKDSTDDLSRPLRLKKLLPEHFSMLSGDDPNCMLYSCSGGDGCVSVISNIAPKICKKLQDLLANNDYVEARKIQENLQDLYNAIFVDTNPIPIKYAASTLGFCSEDVRLPLYKITDEKIKDNIRSKTQEFSKLN